MLHGEYMWRIWRIWPQNATRRSELLLQGTLLLMFQKKGRGQGVISNRYCDSKIRNYEEPLRLGISKWGRIENHGLQMYSMFQISN